MSDELVNEEPTGAAGDAEQQVQEPVRYAERPPESGSLLRSLTRLLVGGTLVAWDELTTQVRSWENETHSIQASQLEDEGIIAYHSEQTVTSGQTIRPPAASSGPEQGGAETADVLLGLLFESQSRFLRRSKAAYRLADKTTGRVVTPLLKRMGNSRFFRPGQRRLNALANRGEDVVERLAERGRAEETYSRLLFLTAVEEAFGTSMDQLAEAPQLQDLVRKQSAGLSQEMLDEVRERTVSGDLVVEHLARSLLRREPRRTLPPPPTALDSAGARERGNSATDRNRPQPTEADEG
jgi:hypothetical protein